MDRRTFLALTGAAAIASRANADDVKSIVIVSSLPRKEPAKSQTDTIVNGIRLAIADYATMLPFEVKYRDLDDADATMNTWDARLERDNAQAAVKDPDVMAYIGPYNSGAAKISMPILNVAGLVQISPATTYPGLTKKVPGEEVSGEPDIYRPSKRITFCRVCPTDDVQGPLTARFAATELKAKTVFVLDDRETYGQMCAKTFLAECKELGIKVLGRSSIDPRARNYRTLLTKVKQSNPDVLYFGGTTQSGAPQLAQDMVGVDMACPLIVPDGCYEIAFIKGAGAENLNDRCYVTIGGVDVTQVNARGASIVTRYKDKYKSEPEAYALYGYECAAVILEAIKTVGKKDREAIRKAVVGTKDFDRGVLGKWSFDANGDTTLQQMTVSKVEKGKFVPVKVITAEPMH